MRKVVFGVHGPAELGDLPPKCLEILRHVNTRVTGYKFLTGHSVSHYQDVITRGGINPDHCMTRLYMDMRGRDKMPSADEFVHDMVGAINDARKVGVNWFELHNEPNLYNEWKESWGGAEGFADWAIKIIIRLRKAFPNIKIVSPGLWPHTGDLPGIGQDIDSWIKVLSKRSVFAACDATGAHAYWGKRSGLNAYADGLNYYRYIPYTNRKIWVTEFSNNQTSDIDFEKGRQYRDYLGHLRKYSSYVDRAYSFVISGADFEASHEAWDRGASLAGIPDGVMS